MAKTSRIPASDSGELLTEDQAAAELNMSVAWLRRKRLEGARNGDAGPAYHKFGASVRYERSDIKAYKDTRRIDRSKNALSNQSAA